MKSPSGSRRVPHLRLKELRVNAGMSPNDLAYRVGVSGKTIRMAEAGFIPAPRTQLMIAAAFDLKPLDLWPFDRGRQCVASPVLA
jgi:DNA-binding XRE family transcriptional regulator